MKKAFDQTVRDIKREVNKKVLKVPGVEQKVLDATSNEPWGPHGSHLADIAQASRNYHEYQMIMGVIWKRINDTGKNWRHVYKALTVLEYLVAHGSERVIDEIREHAYQISTLSDFQYIDSSGRDQGSNVRKKSQSLVVLVNDKERIQEVRQKAAANRDKFRNTSSAGGMYRPSSYSSTGGYDDDRSEGRYGSRDEDRNGYGREREWGNRDDDRYGRYGDTYGRDGDRYNRDFEERNGRDGCRDDDYRGRTQNTDDQQYGSRSRSSDRYRDRAYEDDGQYSSSRGSGARADDQSQDGSFAGRRLDRKYSEQNLSAAPSYEEAMGEARSPLHNERDGETSATTVPKTSSPTASTSPTQATITSGISAAPAPAPAPAPTPANKEVYGFDEFDPRGSVSGAPTTSSGTEMDLLGSLSESFSSNTLAIVPVTSAATTEADASANFGSGHSLVAVPSASTVTNQPFEDPFGDSPFKAVPSMDSVPAQPQNVAVSSFYPTSTNQSFEPAQPIAQNVDTVNNFYVADTHPGMIYTSSSASNVQVPSTDPQFMSQELSAFHQNADILADILPPPGPSPSIQAAFQNPTGQPTSQTGFLAQTRQSASQAGFPAQGGQPVSAAGFPAYAGQPTLQTGFLPHTGRQPTSVAGFPPQASQPASQMGFTAQTGEPAALTGFPTQIGLASQTGFTAPNGQPAQPNANFYSSFLPQAGSQVPVAVHTTSQPPPGPAAQHNSANTLPQLGFAAPVASQAFQTPTGPVPQHNSDFLGNLLPQGRQTAPMASQPASTGSLAIVPQPAKEKFEPKSAVWADTLSRGLVNLNISGSKINPLADIGIDFDAINRKEKRMEKPAAAPVISTVNMGKAMGTGSGIGRAGASALRPSPNAMMGSGMGIGMGGGPGTGIGMGMGMGMGGYGGVNQPMGVGMGTNMPVNMGSGMNRGIGQGVQMQPPTGFPPGSTIPGGYNPMMGTGGYGPQHPYGGGYR